MDEPAQLWRRIHAAFEAHRKPTDKNAQAALERVAVKCLGLANRQAFNASNCSVREAQLGRQSLLALKVYHERSRPVRGGGTIVLIFYGGSYVVLDGNNRVNQWRAQNAPGPFDAIIIEPN